MELFKFIRLGIIFIGVGLSNCSTPGEYKIQGTATGIGQGMVCIISYLDKKADTLAKAEIKEEKFELKKGIFYKFCITCKIPILVFIHLLWIWNILCFQIFYFEQKTAL